MKTLKFRLSRLALLKQTDIDHITSPQFLSSEVIYLDYPLTLMDDEKSITAKRLKLEQLVSTTESVIGIFKSYIKAHGLGTTLMDVLRKCTDNNALILKKKTAGISQPEKFMRQCLLNIVSAYSAYVAEQNGETNTYLYYGMLGKLTNYTVQCKDAGNKKEWITLDSPDKSLIIFSSHVPAKEDSAILSDKSFLIIACKVQCLVGLLKRDFKIDAREAIIDVIIEISKIEVSPTEKWSWLNETPAPITKKIINEMTLPADSVGQKFENALLNLVGKADQQKLRDAFDALINSTAVIMDKPIPDGILFEGKSRQ